MPSLTQNRSSRCVSGLERATALSRIGVKVRQLENEVQEAEQVRLLGSGS